MHMLHNEKLVYENEDLNLTITTHRLRRHTKGFSSTSLDSLQVESISAAAYRRTSRPGWLLASVACWILGLSPFFSTAAKEVYEILCPEVNGVEVGPLTVAMIGVFFGVWTFSKYADSVNRYLQLSGPGHTLEVPAKSVSEDEIERIIQAVEAAREAHRAMETARLGQRPLLDQECDPVPTGPTQSACV